MPKKPIPKNAPSEEDRAEFRKRMNEMIVARIDMFSANAARYADALGAFRASLLNAGFSAEESMQIILRVADQTGSRPMFAGGWRGPWHEHKHEH